MNIDVCRLSDLKEKHQRDQALECLRKIFFQTSSVKIFKNDEDRNHFFFKWTNYYLEKWPQYTYLASRENRSGGFVAYLNGCPDSEAALSFFADKIPSFSLFKDFFVDYPAHLHINCSPEHQGKGIGKMLIDSFLLDLIACKSKGVHIVTTADSQNVSFYHRQEFNLIAEREFLNSQLCFMGRLLL